MFSRRLQTPGIARYIDCSVACSIFIFQYHIGYCHITVIIGCENKLGMGSRISLLYSTNFQYTRYICRFQRMLDFHRYNISDFSPLLDYIAPFIGTPTIAPARYKPYRYIDCLLVPSQLRSLPSPIGANISVYRFLRYMHVGACLLGTIT
jgi:hypothetical protein